MRAHKRTGMARFADWLGHWKPEYDAMDQNELMLQVQTSFNLVMHCGCNNSTAYMPSRDMPGIITNNMQLGAPAVHAHRHVFAL